MKRWIERTAPEGLSLTPQPDDACLLDELGISARLLRLLRQRGLGGSESINRYLSPKLRLLSAPEQWEGIPEAAAVLTHAVTEGRTLAVWGDYDVDGITATALVLDVLEHHNIPVRYHLPDRRSEGYGLNIPTIERLAAEGVSALLTVDCGISHVEAVARARELGMVVVVSDHHMPPEVLPPAHAICNPRIGASPCPHLAGVGVSFYLMAAMNNLLHPHTGLRFDMRDVLDLVTLGTLADMVRLTGENRVLVKNGLLKIAEARRPGLAALKSVCKLAITAKLGAGQVVFSLAPRINAAGRMGVPHTALELLRAPSLDAAMPLAQKLDTMNTERRVEEDRIHAEAREQALQCPDTMGLVLYGKSWHPGIIGIVASRIVEEFHKPTLILCNDGEDVIKGSGRSVADFDLYAALTRMEGHFLGYGGHKLAAGMSLQAHKLEDVRAAFDSVVREILGDTPLTPSLYIDDTLDFSEASNTVFLQELDLLQPFGSGNAEPVFASPRVRVRARRPLGHSGEHVILDMEDESCGVRLSAKAWRMAEVLPPSLAGKYIRLAYTPRIDTYNGVASIDLRIKDWELA